MRSLTFTSLTLATMALYTSDASAQYYARPVYDGVHAVYPNPMAPQSSYGFYSPYSNAGFYSGNYGYTPIYQTVTPGIIYNNQYHNNQYQNPYGGNYGNGIYQNRYRR